MFSSMPIKIMFYFHARKAVILSTRIIFFLERESKIHTCRIIGTGKTHANRKRI